MSTHDEVLIEIRNEFHRYALREETRTAMAQNGRLRQFLEARRSKYAHLTGVDFDAVMKRIIAENALVPADI